MADLFESALGLEEQHLDEGFEEGVSAGRLAGLADGKALGLQKGWEIGHELGYYQGCVHIWRQLDAKSPGFITSRAEKAVASLEDLLTTFPLGDPKDEGIQEAMDALRGRFKAAVAMLGLQDAYSEESGGGGGGGGSLTY